MMMIQEQPPLHIEERLLSFTLYLMAEEEKCYSYEKLRINEYERENQLKSRHISRWFQIFPKLFCLWALTFPENLVYLKSKKVKDKWR